MGFIAELWTSMKVHKKFWLLPILIMVVALGGHPVLSQGSAITPFIHSLF